MDARAAWEACGKPKGEMGIQNIRKKGAVQRKLDVAKQICLQAARDRDARPLAQTRAEVERQAEVAVAGKGVPVEGFRLNSTQVAKARAIKAEHRRLYEAAFVAASSEWYEMVQSGKCGRGDNSADAVGHRHSLHLPPDCRRVCGRSLKKAFSKGRSGVAPLPPGPKAAIPVELVQTVADYASLKQVAGDEQQPRQLAQAALAAVKGTCHAEKLGSPGQIAYFLKRVREISFISTACRKAVDDRRWQYLTNSNLTTWLGGYVECLLDMGFLPESARWLDWKTIILEIDMEIRRRMLNADESHQKLSNEGDKSGTRANVYVNSLLARAGKRLFTYQKHATIMAWFNYAGEVGALHGMLATDAQAAKKGKHAAGGSQADIRVRPEWMFGWPRVRGFFGHATEQVFEPSFVMNEKQKGGMEGGGFEHFLDWQIYPAYPNLAPNWVRSPDGVVMQGPVFLQVDAGPDRYSTVSLASRIQAYERGLVLFPGLPNGTAANQVADDLFGLYKQGCNMQMDDIIAERIKENLIDPSVKVSPPAMRMLIDCMLCTRYALSHPLPT